MRKSISKICLNVANLGQLDCVNYKFLRASGPAGQAQMEPAFHMDGPGLFPSIIIKEKAYSGRREGVKNLYIF